jgi:hypothetical protein
MRQMCWTTRTTKLWRSAAVCDTALHEQHKSAPATSPIYTRIIWRIVSARKESGAYVDADVDPLRLL